MANVIAEESRLIKEFWWLMRFLLVFSMLDSLTVFAMNLMGAYSAENLRSFLDAIDTIFPSINSLTFHAIDPYAWKLYFLLFWLAMPYCWMRIIGAILRTTRTPKTASWSILGVVVSSMTLVALGWLLLFNTTIFTPRVFSPGSALLLTYQTSYVGLALAGWIFMFFVALAVPVIVKTIREMILIGRI